MRDPVVISIADQDRPSDGWMVGDSFFFSLGFEIFLFTVTGFDDKQGMISKATNMTKTMVSDVNQSPRKEFIQYFERLKNKNKGSPDIDHIWNAVVQVAGG